MIIRGVFNFFCAIPKAISAYQKAKADEVARVKAEEEAEEKLRKEKEEDKKQREERKKEKQVSFRKFSWIIQNDLQAKEAERKKREMERRAEQLKEIERLHQEQRFEFTVNALGHDFF